MVDNIFLLLDLQSSFQKTPKPNNKQAEKLPNQNQNQQKNNHQPKKPRQNEFIKTNVLLTEKSWEILGFFVNQDLLKNRPYFWFYQYS